jgi:hypothetical protein
MNLGKLLGAGKSIFGGQAPVVYRQSKQVSLPKFNAGKNPFVPEAPKAADPAPVAAAPAAPTPSVPVAAPAAPAVAAKVATPTPSVFSAGPAKPARPVTPKSVHATNWAEKLNQLWAAKPARATPAATGPMPNVQPDLLTLDSVKVVHNDLSDVDVEVVPMKSRPAAAKPATTEFAGEPVLKPV